jgi:arylsulfatase
MEGGFRAPATIRWPGKVPAGKVENGIMSGLDWFKFEFWRFVFVQEQVAKLAMTAVEFPPMQKGASFNLDAVKAKIQAARAAMGK